MLLKTFKGRILTVSLGMTALSVMIFGYGLASIYYHHMQESLSRSLSYLMSEVMQEHRPSTLTVESITDVVHTHHLQIFAQGDLIHDLQIDIAPEPPQKVSDRIFQTRLLETGEYVIISSSTDMIHNVLLRMLINQWIFFLLGFLITSGLIYVLIRHLFTPFNQLLNHCLTCEDPDQKPKIVTGGVEIIALRDAIASLQERIHRLQITQQDSMKALTHELKTPLARLRLSIDLADHKGEWKAESITAAREEIDIIAQNITQILHSTKDAEKTEKIVIKNSINALIEDLDALWKHRELDVIVEADETASMQLPEKSYERVLRILIENGLNHACHGSRIVIRFHNDTLEVENPVCDKNTPIIHSSGKGLEIAKTLSDYYQWELYDELSDRAYKVVLKLKNAFAHQS